MKIEQKQSQNKLLQAPEMNYSCSELNTTLQFPDYEISISEQTLINTDHHLKKRKNKLELKVRQKELLREQLRLELGFLKNKLRLFKIQTDGKLDYKFSGMHQWIQSVIFELAEDEAQEQQLLSNELEKSFAGRTDIDLEVLDKSRSRLQSSKISISCSDMG